jgi:Flp pilus assembly protein TadD
MMKLLAVPLIALAAMNPAMAESETAPETRYAASTIGYEALMAGDNEKAIADLMASPVSRHDPAFLLNLGQAYMRSGRTAEAREMFRLAMKKRDSVDLVLADGRVMNSKLAARQALATVQVGLASR